MTKDPCPIPLGFSDLTQDEQLLVAVYRDWRGLGPTVSIAEHAIARTLRRDKLYQALEPLFDVFRQVAAPEQRAAPQDSDVLTETEELLLDMLSDAGAEHDFGTVTARCQAALAASGVCPRMSESIPRSGIDRALTRASGGYLSATRL
ncbi:MAG: hypothetical protein AAF713_08580 [Pseudomonadota bacterium]